MSAPDAGVTRSFVPLNTVNAFVGFAFDAVGCSVASGLGGCLGAGLAPALDSIFGAVMPAFHLIEAPFFVTVYAGVGVQRGRGHFIGHGRGFGDSVFRVGESGTKKRRK